MVNTSGHKVHYAPKRRRWGTVRQRQVEKDADNRRDTPCVFPLSPTDAIFQNPFLNASRLPLAIRGRTLEDCQKVQSALLLLINRHSTRHRPMRHIGHLCHITLLIVVFQLSCGNVRLQTFIKVQRAHDGVYYGEDDEDDRDDGEGRQRSPDLIVGGSLLTVVHSDKFEEEVG